MKVDDRVIIKDKVLNKSFYEGKATRRDNTRKIYRIDFFIPGSDKIVKLKYDNGEPGISIVSIDDLEKYEEEE